MANDPFDWSKWGGQGGTFNPDTFGFNVNFTPEEISGTSAWDYNPDKTWRRQGTGRQVAQILGGGSAESPEIGWTTAWDPTDTFERKVGDQWTPYTVDERYGNNIPEEARYLWSGVNDPRFFDKDTSPLEKFLFDNPSILGKVNERNQVGYDANMFQPDKLSGYYSSEIGRLDPTNKYGLADLLDPAAGAAWADYMSAGNQHNRSEARSSKDFMEGLKVVGILGGMSGGFGLSDLFSGGTLGGINPSLGALEGGISAADAAAGMVPEFGSNLAFDAAMNTGAGSLSNVASNVVDWSGEGGTLSNMWDASDPLSQVTIDGNPASNIWSKQIPLPTEGSTADWWNNMPSGTKEWSGSIPGAGGGAMTGLKDIFSTITDPSKWTVRGMLDAARLGLGGLGAINSFRQGNKLRNAAGNAASMANPMGDRTWAVDALKDSYTNPWGSSDANASRRRLQQIADRQGAKRGINPIHTNLALEGELSKVLDERRRTLSNIAGVQFDPANAGRLTLEGLKESNTADRRGYDQIGAAIGSILQGQRGDDLWKWLLSTGKG